MTRSTSPLHSGAHSLVRGVFSSRTKGFRTTLTRGIWAAAMCLPATPAWALTCDEILSMVGYNIPPEIVVQTIESSGSQFADSDVRCLRDGGAPSNVVAAVQGLVPEETAPVTTMTRPTSTPDPEPEPELQGFDLGQALDAPADEGEEIEGPTGPRQLEEIIHLYRQKKFLTASKALFDLLEQDRFPDQETKIEYYLAKSLFDLGMYHSAQHHFMQVVRKGPRDPYFKYALPKLVAIAELHGNDSELLRLVHKVPPAAFPRQARNHLHYLMGRKLYEDGELSEATEHLKQISPKSSLFMRSKYFEGVIHNERGKLKSAVKAFRDVYQAKIPPTDARTAKDLEDLKELALINIARIYYGLERFDSADKWYERVDRTSGYWAQSLFERSWSSFMMNDLNHTLGLLLTVNSPYYNDKEFIPEMTILRGLTFFQLCDYGEVERMLIDFEGTYRPMKEEIRSFLERYSDTDSQELSDQAYDKYFSNPHPGSKLTAPFFLRVLKNRDLAGLVRHMDAMDEEIALIDQQKSVWARSVGGQLKKIIVQDKLRYKKKAGRLLLSEMAKQYDVLTDLLSQSEIIRFEVVDAQRADYEYKTQNPLVESEEQRRLDFATSRDIIYWPFNGEFWKDELGYYRYMENSSCK